MKHASYRTFFDVDPSRHSFTVTDYSPFVIPEQERLKVAELIMRINYTLFLGRFEMDMDEGEIRVCTTVCIEGSHLSQEMISIMENHTLLTIDDYFPVLMSVVHGDKTPQQAFEIYKSNALDSEESNETGIIS